jgi:hypothetical protein
MVAVNTDVFVGPCAVSWIFFFFFFFSKKEIGRITFYSSARIVQPLD